MSDDPHLDAVRTMRGRIVEALKSLGVQFDGGAATLNLLDELITEADALNDANARLTLAADGEPDDDHVTRVAAHAGKVAALKAIDKLAEDLRRELAARLREAESDHRRIEEGR